MCRGSFDFLGTKNIISSCPAEAGFILLSLPEPSLKVSYCDWFLSVVCPSFVNFFLKKTTGSNLKQFQMNVPHNSLNQKKTLVQI